MGNILAVCRISYYNIINHTHTTTTTTTTYYHRL